MLKKTTDILILGAGIGGYEAFRSLAKQFKKHGINKKITIIDRHNYFTFTPMLHEVASGSVQAAHCAIPIREIIHDTPHEFWQTTVEKIDPSKKSVRTSHGTISYQYCIVGLGSKTNYFQTPGAQKLTHHVRDLPGAIALHQEVIHQLEDKNLSNIDLVVVGGGATGVELAGQFCHLAEKEVRQLYPENKMTITIVQSSDYLMKYSHPEVRNQVKNRLTKSGVRILLNSKVKKVGKDHIQLENGKKIKSTITAWTAGFANIAPDFIAEKYCKDGQIKVNQHLQSPKSQYLYALGDIAHCQYKKDHIYPKLGEVAHKQGQYLGKEIASRILKTKNPSFQYQLSGELVPIGDWYAVAHIGPLNFHGRFAWWLRRTVYLHFIPGFMRKLRIVIDWTLHSFGFRHIIDLDHDK